MLFISLLIDYLSNFSSELKPKWMTPAMEEVARLKKKVESPEFVANSESPRVTRSRMAKIKRKNNMLNYYLKQKN